MKNPDSFLKTHHLRLVYLQLLYYFYAPEIEDRGAYCFVLSVLLSFCHSPWNLNIANNFWTVNARALIFHMSIPCDKIVPLVPLFYTLWPWPWSLTHFLKTLTLLITFERGHCVSQTHRVLLYYALLAHNIVHCMFLLSIRIHVVLLHK